MDHRIYLLIFNILLLFFIIGGFIGAIWIPTKKKDYERISRLAGLKPGMVFYDLGSGSADLLFYLSKKYKVRCVGIEVSPLLYLYSKLRSMFFKEGVKIKYGNFLKHDLSEADLIYVFLHPKIYDKLRKKISGEVKKDSTLILLSTWPFKGVNPLKTSRQDNEVSYYLYKKTNLYL